MVQRLVLHGHIGLHVVSSLHRPALLLPRGKRIGSISGMEPQCEHDADSSMMLSANNQQMLCYIK